tara:strand:+ start:67 stop:513 length:447 start_codon:yes stop_codon:yes gene_type:complete
MGFHKRRVTGALIRDLYTRRGIPGLKSILSADAFITESGLATEFIDLTNAELSDHECWIAVEKLVINDIYNKDMYSPENLNADIPTTDVYKILDRSELSREQKLIELKALLSAYSDEILKKDGIDYTYAASIIINEYYAKIKRTENNG